MQGKHVSYWSKIVAPIVTVALIVLIAVFHWQIPWVAAIATGAFVFIVGLPIDASVWMDKLTGLAKLKLGGPQGSGQGQ